MTARYFEWDFENGKVREYARSGECNGCGQCCAAMIMFGVKNLQGRKRDNWARMGNRADSTGVWFEVQDGKMRRFLKPIAIEIKPREEACKSLDENNRCLSHAKKDWKGNVGAICDVWPINPSQVTPFDQCSYSFDLIAEWDTKLEEALQ